MPTIIISENTTGTHAGVTDTSLSSAAPTTNYNSAVLTINNFGAGDQNTGLLRFTLPAVLNGATVTGVRLKFFQPDSNTWVAAGNFVDFYESLRAWTAGGATWNTYDGTNPWTTAGGIGSGDIGTTLLASRQPTGTSSEAFTLSTSELVTLLQAKATASAASVAFAMRPRSLSAPFILYSTYRNSEGTNTQRPALEVDYTAGVVVTVSGTITLDDFTLSGAMATGALSQLAGGITLDALALSGFLGTAPGRIDSSPFKNWTGTLLPGVTIPRLTFLRLSDMSAVLQLADQTTGGGGVLTVTNAALTPGTAYVVVAASVDGASLGAEIYTAT